MGSFVFKWEHPASEVYVTGTFDDWKKTEKLDRIGTHFEKQVELSDASKKIYYKFVVDGNWVTDHTAPKETDESGNENNILTPERIVTGAPATAAIMSSVTPDSTTAALAAGVPLEKEKDYKTDGLPGLFPETPASDLNKEFSVNPLPAAPGAVNPIQLAPGEKIPDHLAAGSTDSNVKLDPESYEKADTLPGGGFAAFSSAAPNSTTAELAAGAPIETKTEVPEVVKESQEKAHVDPEASAVPEEVEEKATVEKELLERVKEAPSTSEGTAGKGTEKTESTVTAGEAAASVAAAATALGGAAVAGAFAAKNIAVDKGTAAVSTAQETATQAASNLPESVKAQLPESVQNAIGTTAKETTIQETAPAVPVEVKESLAEAGQSPEAAASATAVEDKKAFESELLKEVKPVAAIGEEAKKAESKIESTAEAVKTDAAATVDKALGNVEKTVAVPETETATFPKVAPEAPAAPAVAEPETTTTSTTAVANGTGAPSTAAESAAPAKPTETPATAEKKKKNRISAFFSKLKSKKSDK